MPAAGSRRTRTRSVSVIPVGIGYGQNRARGAIVGRCPPGPCTLRRGARCSRCPHGRRVLAGVPRQRVPLRRRGPHERGSPTATAKTGSCSGTGQRGARLAVQAVAELLRPRGLTRRCLSSFTSTSPLRTSTSWPRTATGRSRSEPGCCSTAPVTLTNRCTCSLIPQATPSASSYHQTIPADPHSAYCRRSMTRRGRDTGCVARLWIFEWPAARSGPVQRVGLDHV